MSGSNIKSTLDRYTPATFTLHGSTFTVASVSELFALMRESRELYDELYARAYALSLDQLPKPRQRVNTRDLADLAMRGNDFALAAVELRKSRQVRPANHGR